MSTPLRHDLPTLLPTLLAEVKQPGNYYGTGVMELPLVRFTVDGVGALGFPIPPVQAEQLYRVATPAPYGRGPKTLVDTDVRRCGQIAAAAVHADDPRWKATMEIVLAAAEAAMGVDGSIGAELYKLLVYQPGDFFVPHRDTEKVPRMFGTLVVLLPSEHEGGELRVRHAGREALLDLSPASAGQVRWAAFYADCEHELLPLRSGWRIALIYNLIRPKGRAPTTPDDRPTVGRVVDLLRAWAKDPTTPPKLVLPLSHRYTPAELSFASLKNEDAAIAQVLVSAAAQAGCVLRLAMVSIVESGSAEPVWSGRRSDWRLYEDEDEEDEVSEEAEEYEVTEVLDRSQTLDAWHTPDDKLEALGSIGYLDEEVSPPGSLIEEDPDEDLFHEATGNGGASFERTYRRAALVFWPAGRELEVMSQGGRNSTLGLLTRLIEGGAQARASALATLLLNEWPTPNLKSWRPYEPELGGRLLGLLHRLEDRRPVRRYLLERLAVGAFDGSESEALLPILECEGAAFAKELLLGLIGSVGRRAFLPVAGLLAQWSALHPGRALEPLIRAELGLLSGPDADQGGGWDRTDSAKRSAGLLCVISLIGAGRDPTLGGDLAAGLLARPERWPLDGLLIPALLTAPKKGNAASRAATEPLREACRAHLRRRISLPLSAPADARRSIEGLSCTCVHCTSLKEFLVDPVRTSWTLKAREELRAHVQQMIAGARSDLAQQTNDYTRPKALTCTKTQASYDALVRQRQADIAALAELYAP